MGLGLPIEHTNYCQPQTMHFRADSNSAGVHSKKDLLKSIKGDQGVEKNWKHWEASESLGVVPCQCLLHDWPHVPFRQSSNQLNWTAIGSLSVPIVTQNTLTIKLLAPVRRLAALNQVGCALPPVSSVWYRFGSFQTKQFMLADTGRPTNLENISRFFIYSPINVLI